jgi:hypothetical protein
MGLAKNLTLFGTAAIAHNIQKAAKFLRLYACENRCPRDNRVQKSGHRYKNCLKRTK